MSGNLLVQKGNVFIPGNLVNYQEGSVVSRMITYTPQGTVTIFAFAAESGLSEHTAPYDAMIQILEGSAEISLEGVLHTLHAGEYIILPASVPHALYAKEQFKMILTMIHA